MERALAEAVITGVPQTASFLRRVIADEAFHEADLDTGFLMRNMDRLLQDETEVHSAEHEEAQV